jgi:membrane-associated HD superfamily phosphohydrolase
MNEEERRDRQMLELLNELRVALPGVQILFAFLLAVPFTTGWEKVTNFQREVFFVTLLATAVSTACFIAPSAAHRIRFHQRDRTWLIESGSRLMIAGLVALAVAMAGVVLLITDVLYDGAVVPVVAVAVAAVIGLLWFVRPLARHAGQGD